MAESDYVTQYPFPVSHLLQRNLNMSFRCSPRTVRVGQRVSLQSIYCRLSIFNSNKHCSDLILPLSHSFSMQSPQLRHLSYRGRRLSTVCWQKTVCWVISHRVVNFSHMAIVCKSLAVLTLVRRWKQDDNHFVTHYLYIRTVGGSYEIKHISNSNSVIRIIRKLLASEF